MKDATSTAPLENGNEKSVIKIAKQAIKGTTNGDLKSTTEESEASIDAYENSLLHNSDSSDLDSSHLELELSDEDVDSSASTLALSGSNKSEVSEATTDVTTSGEAVVEGSQVTSTTEGDTENAADEENVTKNEENGVRASSPDCVEVPESEPIVHPKSSTNDSSDDAAKDNVSVSEDAFSVAKETDSLVEDDACIENANAGQNGLSVDVDDSDAIIDGSEKGGDSPRPESEVVSRLESKIVEKVDKKLSEKPEIQVIDLDDSSSESDFTTNKIEACLGESDEVSKKEARTSFDSKGSLPGDVLREPVDTKGTKSEVLPSSTDDFKEISEETVLKQPESGANKVENDIADVDELKIEDADDEVDKLTLVKVNELPTKEDVTSVRNSTPELVGEPEEKLTADTSEEEISLSKSADSKEEGAVALAVKPCDETPSTSSLEVADKEVVSKEEAEPSFTVAEIVSLTLDTLIAYVVNKSEGITIPVTDNDEQVTDEAKHPLKTAKVDDSDVISLGDDSNESDSMPGLEKVDDKAIAKLEDVKDMKSANDTALPKGASHESVTKEDNVEDQKPTDLDPNDVANEKDDNKSLLESAPVSNAANVTEVSDLPRRPKRSSVQKAEQLAIAKKMKLSNSSENLSNLVRSVSKENLNPAQKRASAASSKDDAKKSRVEPLRKPKRKKEMSNLDKAIARVATGETSTRSQELANLIGQLSSKTLETITATQLEELILFMIGKYVLEQSDCATYRKEVAQLKAEVDVWQTAAKSMSKQVQDLENVMKKMITDIKDIDKDSLPIPAKVTRSVGLQVGDGRITNEQKKLAIPRVPMPPPAQPTQPPPARRLSAPLSRPPAPVTATVTTATVTSPPRLRRPTSVPARRPTPPGPAPVELAGYRTSNVLLPSNSPTKSPGLPVTAGPMRRSLVSAVARTPTPTLNALIDLTDGDDSPVPTSISPAPTIQPTPPSKIRVLNPINTTTATTKPAVKPGSLRLVQQSTLTGPAATSTRVAYMVPASGAGGESRMYFTTTTSKQQVSLNGATVVQRPAAVQPRQVVYNTSGTNSSPTSRDVQPRPNAYVAANRPAPGSVIRARPVHVERKVLHPAPLPPTPASPSPGPGWKKSPPLPELKISKCDKRSRSGGDSGIILSWKMDSLGADHDEIKSYQLYAYQETTGEPSTTMWKKVGEVTAMALPMACTLTQFTEGNKYHFAVRAVDVRGRIGPFSKPGNILLSSPFDN